MSWLLIINFEAKKKKKKIFSNLNLINLINEKHHDLFFIFFSLQNTILQTEKGYKLYKKFKFLLELYHFYL